MNLKNNNYISLIVWISSLILIGSSIGFLTKTSIDTWYVTLNRSPLSPPNYLFSVVWTILYAMIGISGWIIWNSINLKKLPLIKILYISQLIFNWSWTPLFFVYHETGLALICLFLMIILVGLIIIHVYNKINMIILLFTPYFIWLLFAGYLNFYIWQYN